MKSYGILLSLIWAWAAPATGQQAADEVPVIIIMADQLRADVLGRYTPHINALQADGVQFQRAYTASPLCVPARGAFFTGCYPNTTGSLINGWVKDDEHFSRVAPGTDNLYRAMSRRWVAWQVGKQHFITDPPIDEDSSVAVHWVTQKAYNSWMKAEGVAKPGGRSFTDYAPELVSATYTHLKRYTLPVCAPYPGGLGHFPDGYFGAKAVDIIAHHPAGRPLLLNVTFMAPHPPFHVPEPYYSMISPEQVRVPANVGRWYPGQSPLQMYTLTGFIGSRYSREQWEAIWPKYLGLVHLLDDQVGRIMEALKRKGLYDKALIVFTADHGEMLGSHRLWMKNCLYEESARVPLIIKFPADFKPAIRSSSQLVSLIDVWPTLKDFLHIRSPDSCDGMSLMPLLQGKPWNRERIFMQYDGNAGYGSRSRGIIEGTFKLIVDTFKDEFFLELYDLERDPQETRNLAANPAAEKRVRRMLAELKGFMRDTGDRLILPEDPYALFRARPPAMDP